MNCSHARLYIEDLIDGYIPGSIRTQIKKHLHNCSNCQQFYLTEQSLRKELRHLPSPKVSPQFVQQALQTFAPSQSTTPVPLIKPPTKLLAKHQWFASGFVSAIAASLAIWVGSVLFIASDPPPLTAIPEISFSINEPRTVNMVFNVPKDLMNVTFVVNLPNHAELLSHPGESKVQWQGQLYQGNNLLPLTMVVRAKIQGYVLAKIYYQNEVKTFKLQVETLPLLNASQARQPTIRI